MPPHGGGGGGCGGGAGEDPRDGRCLRLRGLPFGVSEAQIAEFLGPCASADEIVVVRRDGKCTGNAFVVCGSPAEAGAAFRALNKRYLGRRYIEVFNAAPSEVAAAAAGGADDYDAAVPGGAAARGAGRRGRGAERARRGAGGGGGGGACGSPRASSGGGGRPGGGTADSGDPWALDAAAAQGARLAVARLSGVPPGAPPAELAAWLAAGGGAPRGGAGGLRYVVDAASGLATGEVFAVFEDATALGAALGRGGALLRGAPVAATAASAAEMAAALPPRLPPSGRAASEDSGCSSPSSSSGGRGARGRALATMLSGLQLCCPAPLGGGGGLAGDPRAWPAAAAPPGFAQTTSAAQQPDLCAPAPPPPPPPPAPAPAPAPAARPPRSGATSEPGAPRPIGLRRGSGKQGLRPASSNGSPFGCFTPPIQDHGGAPAARTPLIRRGPPGGAAAPPAAWPMGLSLLPSGGWSN
ncbi:MAG: hypothetical protein J3K34DRAFT_483910 [Monoraphidium minutum]|nr:MAG: hypothetical protein J3K34DRAFT_483910 [Monoraphidium minutum]